jgi:hypothetical protein
MLTGKNGQPLSGSRRMILLLIAVSLALLVGRIYVVKKAERIDLPIPQVSQQVDGNAYYIAQTALDRSIKALVDDPSWRSGFRGVPFENGTYNVILFDSKDDGEGSFDPSIPPDYVRIVASSEVDGITREVEAIWVDAMSAFQYAYACGEEIELVSHDTRAVVVGNIHHNAWNNGEARIHEGLTLYGDVISPGEINLGIAGHGTAAAVYGNLWADRIHILENGEVRKYQDLTEWIEGVDLNGDGDNDDAGLSLPSGAVAAASALTAAGKRLTNGERDSRVSDGNVPARVGGNKPGAIVDPRPDFIVYYELTTGLSTYPPRSEHLSSPISGDGSGHYFASSKDFMAWLDHDFEREVLCWQCAGDGMIDPYEETPCPTCGGMGRDSALEIAGVFYIDDELLDLSSLQNNLIVHGTLVVADGNPYLWPTKIVDIPGGKATIDHFPQQGRLVLKGATRKHVTVTYRSDQESGTYTWNRRVIHAGEDAQTLPIQEPLQGHFMRGFPAIMAPAAVLIESRGAGFAIHRGDIGGESLTILQGLIFTDGDLRMHGKGGWDGGPIVFDEGMERRADDLLHEPILNLDLNSDGDLTDQVEISSISSREVIPVARNRFHVDVNNDGILDKVVLGDNYIEFFRRNGYVCPVLIYHEGILMGRRIHSCEQYRIVLDPLISASGVPFGFEVNFRSTAYPGLVSWTER